MPLSETQKKLYELACLAKSRAYQPYSEYNVGCALQTIDGQQFLGCNVENAAYGSTVCAEANTVSNMVAYNGPTTIAALMLVASGDTFPSPCGNCRQIIAEFATPETEVHLGRAKDDGTGFEVRTYRMSGILPLSFTQSTLFMATKDEQPQEPDVMMPQGKSKAPSSQT